MTVVARLDAARAWMSALFVEREIFLRSAGRVRFVRVTRRAQIGVALVVGLALTGWAVMTLAMLAVQLRGAAERASLARAEGRVARDAATMAAYRHGSGNLVDDLRRRQAMIEQLVTSRLGAPGPAPAASPTPTRTSALPDAHAIADLGARQDAFALHLASLFDARSARAAGTLRRIGIDPAAIDAAGARAQGGPLMPWPADGAALTPALSALARAVGRWSVLQANLVAIPSSTPTDGTMVTSSYGVRSDPFTGQAAFHAGLDFVGAYGQPIRAAAAGTIAFVGQRSGYGNVVEVDHGHDILTRYAHLSGFVVHPGEHVARGEPIARMGSTGRSTGTHLHFEVRVKGAPVNPLRFLALNQEIADVR